MKFVVSRGGTNNPQWLKDSAAQYTPEIIKLDGLPKGFRFELTNPDHIQRIKEGQMAVIDDDSTKSRVEIKKIEAEVREEERVRKLAVDKKSAESAANAAADAARNRANKSWWEKPAGMIYIAVFSGIVAGVVAFILCEYLKHRFPQFFGIMHLTNFMVLAESGHESQASPERLNPDSTV